MEDQVHSTMDNPEAAPSISSQYVDSDDSVNEELPLTVLFRFIKPFNGDRSELTTFLQNANSAFSLAVPHQRPPLLLFVVSQLSTSVVNELELSEVHSWHELKDKLKLYYSHTKHLAQAHEELEIIRQHPNETITDFFKRVERAKNDCIQAETINSKSEIDLPGLKRAIQQTALRRFIIHCKPEISQMLRARDINSLNDAYSLALQEEKIINYTKIRAPNQAYCSYCKKNNHTASQCRKKNQNSRTPTQMSPGHYRPTIPPTNYGNGYNSSSNGQFRPSFQNRPPYTSQFTPRPQLSDHRPYGAPFARRPDNSNGTRNIPSHSRAQINNVQTQDFCQAPVSNVPSERDEQIQETFKAISITEM